jgi:hypothetical protein
VSFGALSDRVRTLAVATRGEKRWDQFRERLVGELYYERLRRNDGLYVAEEDWDNLLILDAARFDFFFEALSEQARDPDAAGDLDVRAAISRIEKRISRGSATPQFLRENFADSYHPEIVYVTANPMVNTTVPNSFSEVISVWRSAWDESEGTVLPSDVRRAAIDAAEKHPHKRLIVHFMQPHWPFIGYDRERDLVDFTTAIADPALSHPRDESDASIWDLLRAGAVDPEKAWVAYRENHREPLADALKLIEDLDGRSVITSDHGNALGERAWPFDMKVYGHPPKIRLPSLVEVPWLTFEAETRRKIDSLETQAPSPTQANSNRFRDRPNAEQPSEVAESRLEALGYK